MIRKTIIICVFFVLIIVFAMSFVGMAELSSTNFKTDYSVSSGGMNTSSTNYKNNLIAGTITGNITSTNYNLYLGFWYATENNLPVISNVNIAPSNPGILNDLNCSFTITDQDPGETLYANYVWYNGTNVVINTSMSVQNGTLNYTILGSGNTSTGDTWNCTVTPYDQYNYGLPGSAKVTVGNLAPTTPTPTINSTNGTNKTTEDLNCFDTILDDDNEAMNVTVRWYKNETLSLTVDYNSSYANGTAFSAVFGSANTSKGDNWSCSMRLFDGTGYSSWGNSSNLTILNTLPSNVTLISPTNGNDTLLNRTPTFIWTAATDADDDNLSYHIEVYCPTCVAEINVTSVNATNWTAQNPLDLDKEYYWQVRAYDGEGFGNRSNTWNFTILSTNIIVVNGSIDFGEVSLGQVINTTEDNPAPLTVENNGNVDVNISIYAQDLLWTRDYASFGTSYVQFMAGNSSEANSFDWELSVTSWTNMNNDTNKIETFKYLNFTDSKDFAELELRITVPSDEPPGDKNMTVVFEAKEA